MRMFAMVCCALAVSFLMGAALPRATYLKRSAFRDSPALCFTPVDPGQGNAVSAFAVSINVCPQGDPAQIESPPPEGCSNTVLASYPATPAQKNWVKAAWSQALLQKGVPEAAQDAP